MELLETSVFTIASPLEHIPKRSHLVLNEKDFFNYVGHFILGTAKRLTDPVPGDVSETFSHRDFNLKVRSTRNRTLEHQCAVTPVSH
jgi:hypothetical protein